MEPSLPLVNTTPSSVAILVDPYPHSTAPPTTAVGVAIWTLPEDLTPQWDKQPIGDQMVTNIASLLESGNGWQCRFHLFLSDSST